MLLEGLRCEEVKGIHTSSTPLPDLRPEVVRYPFLLGLQELAA
jgi:hypothetical protein